MVFFYFSELPSGGNLGPVESLISLSLTAAFRISHWSILLLMVLDQKNFLEASHLVKIPQEKDIECNQAGNFDEIIETCVYFIYFFAN